MNRPAHLPPDSTGDLDTHFAARFLTLRETAAFLNVHPNTVRSQVRRGKLPGAKIGRGWRFLEADLIANVRSRYPNASRVPRAGSKSEFWSSGAEEDFMLPGARESTERALDALLERPTGSGPAHASI